MSNTEIKGEKAVDLENVVINAALLRWTLAYPNPRISTKDTFLEVATLIVWADKPKVKGFPGGIYKDPVVRLFFKVNQGNILF